MYEGHKYGEEALRVTPGTFPDPQPGSQKALVLATMGTLGKRTRVLRLSHRSEEHIRIVKRCSE